MSVSNFPWSGAAVFITVDGCIVDTDSTRWSQILVENRNFYLPHLYSNPPLGGLRQNIDITFGTEKLEWCGYQTVKNLKICFFVSTEYMNVTNRQTDGRTDTQRLHRLRLCITSRGKHDCILMHCGACVTSVIAAGCYATATYALCHHAVSVRPSVTFVDSVKTSKNIFNFFHHRVATQF